MSELVDKAIRDAKGVAKLARDSAMNDLLEILEPGVKRLVDRTLKESLGTNNDLSIGEGKMEDEKDLDMESIAGMFPAISESEDDMAEAAGDELDEADIPSLDEMDSLEGDLDEEIEIDEAELAKVYDEALALEVKMTSGLKDLDLTGKEEVDQGGAIHDVKGGEQYFGDVEPPAKKDWTVREVKQMIKAGLAENKRLRSENARLAREHRELVEKLSKMNLFNTKMLHVNKFFAEHKLSKTQQKAVVESIDRARSVKEVGNIYRTLESTFRAAGVMSESAQKPKANSQRVRTPGASQTVIRESVDGNAGGKQYSRWQELAGILK